ncbi:MAG TPA: TetR family transcriptional regulator, partial [Polyangiaceae bacterium]|nr:TetR family transcriptional regulator [Polyangiaceae bacterium]
MTALGELLPARRERSGEATSKRILEAAEVEFAAKGFDGVRLAAIARAADVPQALIHHYFEGKEGLYREVIERALQAIADVGWRILDTMAPPRRRTKGKRFEKVELEGLVEALVGMLVGFYATHARVLRILRHEAMRGGPLAGDLVRKHVKPQLDDVVARFEAMRASGEVRADVDARQLCISTVAMACFPYTDEAFIGEVWSLDPHS